jgi:hypothetical protein
MKKHKLDKLFSDKLDDYQNIPSPQAWEKLDESLKQQTPKQIWTWISIAASAALVAVSSWYMLSTDNTSNNNEYAYSDNLTEDVAVPLEIVLVPVFIQVPVFNTITDEPINNQNTQIANNDAATVEALEDIQQAPVTLTDNKVLEHQLAPIIKEPLPLVAEADKELIMASSKETIAEEQLGNLEPLTIIYIQGEPEPVSNFTKAINYMEDVRKGDKKLINFKKIGEGIKSKFKSDKEVNSK